MNRAIVFHDLARAMLPSSMLFLLPALVSLIYREYSCMLVFLAVGVGVALLFLPAALIRPKDKRMFAREGMVIAALLWVVFSIVGAVPYYVGGWIPDFWSALFESTSGFTTTGATVLSNVEVLPKGVLFWRCLSNWVGGMGVLVLAIAILPSSSDSIYLMRAECAGPQVSKIVPKGKQSAAYLYLIYTGMTVATMLILAAGGMPIFDSICHGLSIAGTGGFSVRNDGIFAYGSSYLEIVSTVAMILFGVNYSLYYLLLVRRFRDVRRNTELKVYLAILGASILLIAWNIYPLYHTIGKCFRYAAFQVAAVMTSTGFAAADYNGWPLFSQMVLLLLMFIGGCAGSTSGGFKVQRFVILFKSGSLSLRKMLHPNSVNIIKSDGKTISAESEHGVMRYLVIYLGLMILSLLCISLDHLDFGTAFSAVNACINNIGPGLNAVGPMENYGGFSVFSKLVLSVDMLLGRLECLPLLILCIPAVWRKNF